MTARLAPTKWAFLAAVSGLSVVVGLIAGVEPKLAIVASLAIGFVLLVFVDLATGLAVFGFFSFLELLHLGSAISVGKLGGALLAVGWLAYLLSEQDAKEDFFTAHPGMSLVFGVFLGWVALSALWAQSTPEVLGAFGRYLLNVMLFFIVFTAIRDRRQASLVIAGFLAGAVAAGLYGFLSGTQQVYRGRLSGGGLDPNELASVLVAGIALSVGLAAGLKRAPGLRLVVLGGGAFCFLTALLTGSRGGLVALVCMTVAAIAFGGRWRGRVMAVGALLALLATFYIVALAPPEIHDRITSSSQGETRVEEARTTLWEIGERMVRAEPVHGVGAANFQTVSRHYLLQPGAVYRSDVVIATPQVTHNTYLQIAAELGIVGFALFASIVGFSLRCSWRAARRFQALGDIAGEALARGVLVALVGVLAADTFISQEYNKQLWLLLGIGPAILAIAPNSTADSRPRGEPAEPPDT
jgi:O-antigen ligase